jgi:hypothetical protein
MGPEREIVRELCDVGEMFEQTLSSQRIHNQGRGWRVLRHLYIVGELLSINTNFNLFEFSSVHQ